MDIVGIRCAFWCNVFFHGPALGLIVPPEEAQVLNILVILAPLKNELELLVTRRGGGNGVKVVHVAPQKCEPAKWDALVDQDQEQVGNDKGLVRVRVAADARIDTQERNPLLCKSLAVECLELCVPG